VGKNSVASFGSPRWSSLLGWVIGTPHLTSPRLRGEIAISVGSSPCTSLSDQRRRARGLVGRGHAVLRRFLKDQAPMVSDPPIAVQTNDAGYVEPVGG
jgi:hypothetical protein